MDKDAIQKILDEPAQKQGNEVKRVKRSDSKYRAAWPYASVTSKRIY